ncbi:uncharacterized protein OCT59_000232 [Rhizophagus irregularis]|uniref:uncharacterized protein n=1 Tax=Rhizophagus irregularis TaxID=588596 RepID=UPI0033179C2B|nr:hypothetical protein OCT59_000232 [Rhizophagus irregularis]
MNAFFNKFYNIIILILTLYRSIYHCYLYSVSREIDTIAIDKADEVHTEANTKRNQAVRPVIIEYSQWQEKLLVKDAKNNELGLRFTVTNTLKIRDELIDRE